MVLWLAAMCQCFGHVNLDKVLGGHKKKKNKKKKILVPFLFQTFSFAATYLKSLVKQGKAVMHMPMVVNILTIIVSFSPSI